MLLLSNDSTYPGGPLNRILPPEIEGEHAHNGCDEETRGNGSSYQKVTRLPFDVRNAQATGRLGIGARCQHTPSNIVELIIKATHLVKIHANFGHE